MISVLVGYDQNSGEIKSQVLGLIEGAQRETLEGYGLSTVIVPNTDFLFSQYEHYVLAGEVTERPTSPVSRTSLTLLDVPAGSKLTINGVSYDAEGTVELEFPLPGTYSLRVECFPFLDWNDEVVIP
jgi:hypothetical protein